MSSHPTAHPATPSVLVVLLNWNSADETVAAVHAVLASTYPNFSVLVLDNGSTDGSPERLQTLASPSVELLLLPENTGYTGGCNRGLQLALDRGFDFVWLLNNDTVTPPETLASLVNLAQSDPKLALVSPQILSLQEPEKAINLGGIFTLDPPVFQTTNLLQTALDQARNSPEKVIVLGTALLIRSAVLRKIGLLDDRFFAYWEDSDLAVRSLHAGLRNALDFNSAVLHSNKNSVPDPNTIAPHFWYYMARNETVFWRKHLGLRLRLLKALFWALKLNRVYLRMLNRNPAARQALAAGIWEGWLGRTGPFHPRRRAPALVQHLLTPAPSSTHPLSSETEVSA